MPRTSSSDSSDDGQYFVPTEGTYIVVQLDPVNMVEPLRDPDLTAAAQGLQACKYIAYVYHIIDLPIPRRLDHKCRIALVGRGPCQQDDDADIDASMCVPTSPTTDHPFSRKPVPTRLSFPFPNCYQYSMAVPIVRIPTKFFYDHTNAVAIPPYDLFSVKAYMSEDHRKRAALQAARSQPAAEPLSDEDSVELRSTRAASIPVAGERDAEEVPALLSDATPSWTTQPAADVLGSGPQSVNCSAGTHGGDNTTEPKHTAPDNVDGYSTNHARDGKLRDPGYLDRSQVGMTRTALAPDASDACVRITADAQAHCSVESFGERSVIRHYGRLDGVDDGQSGSSTPSMIESISDRPRSASPAPSDLLYRVFLGNPDEDRDIIPLVSISLDLAEVSEVNNPMAFLREVEDIQWLVVEHRRRQARAAWEHEECSDVTSFDTSWTGVDADLQRDTPARNDKKNSDTYHTVMLKVKACAMRVRRRWGNVLKVLRAIPTSLKSTYRVTFHAS